MMLKMCTSIAWTNWHVVHRRRSQYHQQDQVSVWDVVYIPTVEHQRDEVNVGVLAGTRSLQAIKNTKTAYTVSVRAISCYCYGCYDETENQCENKEWVQPWSNRTLKLVANKNDKLGILYK